MTKNNTNRATGPRPHTWCTGPCPVRHAQYRAWAQARAQAHFRNEDWGLSFQEWVAIWGSDWARRGRQRDCLMLMKIQWNAPWTRANVSLVTRAQFHQRQGQIRAAQRSLSYE